MICGIIGKARVGKNQFADYLQDCFLLRHRRSFTPMAFAAELKNMCQDHFDLSDDQLWGDKKEIPDERYNKPAFPNGHYWTAREIMQELGSFYRRIHGQFWVESLGKTMDKRGIEDVIITDVRHINECEFVRNRQGVLIRVKRDDADEIHGMEHESETALDGLGDNYFDMEINNNGTLKNLYGAAEDASDAIIIIENITKKGRIEVNGN